MGFEVIYNYLDSSKKKQFYLIIQYYKDKNQDRQDEIDACLKYNITNNKIHKIIVLVEEGRCELKDFNKKFKSDKIDARLFPRIKFNNVFEFCKEFLPVDAICGIANNDIILCKNADWATCLPNSNCVQTLTRHEIYNQNKAKIDDMAYMKSWCNDLWVFQNPVRELKHIDFQIGDNPGCDNAINHRFSQAGYWCINDAHKFITYHIDFEFSRKVFGEMKMCKPSDKKEHQAWSNPAKEGAYYTPITGEWKEHTPPFKLLDILPKLTNHYHSSYFEEHDTIKL
jgi:hypothetical protein